MSEPKEITVKLKDDERTLTHKFLIYDDVTVASDDPIIQGCIEEARQDYSGEPDSIKVTIALEVVYLQDAE